MDHKYSHYLISPSITFLSSAYIVQTELRQKAESRLMTIVVNRMDAQDRALKGSTLSNIEEYEE